MMIHFTDFSLCLSLYFHSYNSVSQVCILCAVPSKFGKGLSEAYKPCWRDGTILGAMCNLQWLEKWDVQVHVRARKLCWCLSDAQQSD